MNFIADSLYKAFSKAETGGIKDPWIRTYGVPGSSSTAYGPVQITATLAKDYLNRFENLFDQKEKDYLRSFLEQGERFKEFGREPDKEGYEPRYDYGGGGDLTSEEDKKTYENVAKKMLMQHYRNNKGNLSDTIKEWRFGSASPKGKEADTRYWREVEETFLKEPLEEDRSALLPTQEVQEDITTPDQASQTAPSFDPISFIENLDLLMEARRNAPSSASQEPTEAVTATEEEVVEEEAEPHDFQQAAIDQIRAALKDRTARGEKKLKRTHNEAKLEALAKGDEEKSLAGMLKSSPEAMEVVKKHYYDRPTNVQKKREEPVRREDDSKDPTYGIF